MTTLQQQPTNTLIRALSALVPAEQKTPRPVPPPRPPMPPVATRGEYQKFLKECGFEHLGSGMMSSVYGLPGANWVLKVSSDVAWLAFITWAQETPERRAFVPKLYSVKWHHPPGDWERDYYVATMERVEPADERGEEGNFRRSAYFDDDAKAFVKDMEKNGNFRCRDLHEGNWGFRSDGSVVVFDPTGMEDDCDDTRYPQMTTLRYCSPRDGQRSFAFM